MADRPFALWRPLSDGQQATGADHFPDYPILAEFAPFYEAAAARGIAGLQLDEMELWQVGAAMGLASDQPEHAPGGRRDPAALLPAEYLEERARAIAEGRPLPDPPLIKVNGKPPSTADLFQQVPRVGTD